VNNFVFCVRIDDKEILYGALKAANGTEARELIKKYLYEEYKTDNYDIAMFGVVNRTFQAESIR
jgi:hypothetical protein